MRPIYLLVCLYSVLSVPQWVHAQGVNIGRPFSTHFSKPQYGGGTQNWGFTQDALGRIFVGNNNGLLIFDGQKWELYPLPNRTIVRSVEAADDNKIYVGGQGELGYFYQLSTGAWSYRDFLSSIPEAERNFSDLWDIEIFEGSVFFRANDRVFRYTNGKIRVVCRNAATTYLGRLGDALYLHDQSRGLRRYTAGGFEAVGTEPLLVGVEVKGMLPLDSAGSLLVVSLDEGLYRLRAGELSVFTTSQPEFFRQNKPQTAAKLLRGEFAIGTANAGVVVVQADGKIKYQLDKWRGLQNSHVLALYTDRIGNLWAGLENGIDFIHTRSPFRYFYPDGDLESPAYAARIFNQKLYVGLASGLYELPWPAWHDAFSTQPFKKTENSSGQVWGIDLIDEKMYVAHHEGAFRLDGSQLTRLGELEGVWHYLPGQENRQKLLAGTYRGLYEYAPQQDEWTPLGDFVESSRFVERDRAERIWISHPYRGIYRFQSNIGPDEAPRRYGTNEGLPSDNYDHLFRVHDELVVVGERGVFEYNARTDSFEIHPIYGQLFDPNERVIRLAESPGGDVWFVTDRNTGVIEVIDEGIERKLRKRIFPEIQGKLMAGFEYIYPYDAQNVFFGSSKGLIHLDPTQQVTPDSSWAVWIKSVSLLPADSTASVLNAATPTFPNSVSGIRFLCAASTFELPKRTLFRYQLLGQDEDWSAWTDQSQKEYNNLSPGSYRFIVQAKNAAGIIRQSEAFSFEVAPPWYASKLAFVLYVLLGIATILSLLYLPQRAFRKEKNQLETVYQRKEASRLRKLEQTEQALEKLEKERLEDEVRFKNRELASTTMHLVQKNELLIKLKNELSALIETSEQPEVVSGLKKLIRLLKRDIRLDDDWEQFSHHFDHVHQDFVSRLIEAYPRLTPNDHRLCAYLRMNLSSKEIAPLMNISVRGVEVSRYRLRKKLGLKSEDNLTEFMMKF